MGPTLPGSGTVPEPGGNGRLPAGVYLSVALRIGLLVAVLCVPVPARAFMLMHHDLTSLAFESDAVVRAERLGPLGDGSRFRVTEVFAGSLRAGQEVAAGTGIYDVSGSFSGIALSPEPEVFLFLTRRDGGWYVTPSGLRVVDGGDVYRFEQWSNPGPYTAVPQGPDPDDVLEPWSPYPAVGVASFVPMVRRAVRRGSEARAALAISDPSRRLAALLAVLPPPSAERLTSERGMGFYQDLLADEAARVLAEVGDVDGVLEVWARSTGWMRRSGHLLDPPQLLPKALDGSVPEHRRVAALERLFEGELPTEAQARRVLSLLTDPSPDVRALAIASLDRVARTQSTVSGWSARQARIRGHVRTAVRRAWRTETDAGARVAMVEAARVWRFALRRGDPVAITLERHGGRLRWRWASRPPRDDPRVEVTVDGCAPAHPTGWHGQGTGGGALTPGCSAPWTAVLRVDGHEVDRRTVR